MGCCVNLFRDNAEIQGQFDPLVTVKAVPVTIDGMYGNTEEKMEVPRFAKVADEDVPFSDPESLTDTELNRYAAQLSDEEEEK